MGFTDILNKVQAKTKMKAGLDIGANAVKAVEISESAGKVELAGIGLAQIAEPSKRSTIDAIRSAVASAGIASKEFTISVAGSFVIVRFLTMPRMKDEELKGAVRFEAEKFIPFNINDCILDFQVLVRRDHDNKIDILLAAAKKDHVMEKVRLVEDSGYTARLVDVDTFALANAFLKNFPALDTEKTFALLDIGSKFTNLSIIKGGEVKLVRDMAIGGNDFSIAIAKECGVDMATAETMKILPPKDRQKDVMACIKAVFSSLTDEMRLPLSYYENQYGRGVDEMYLSGGAGGLVGLDEMFEESLDLKPLFWNPFQFMNITSGKNSNMVERMKNHFAVAVGLALR